MDATKRPFTSVFTWVIRDADNHRIGQIDNEERAHFIVTAVNLFPEMVEALKFSRSVHISQGFFDTSERMAVEKIDALLKRAKRE